MSFFVVVLFAINVYASGHAFFDKSPKFALMFFFGSLLVQIAGIWLKAIWLVRKSGGLQGELLYAVLRTVPYIGTVSGMLLVIFSGISLPFVDSSNSLSIQKNQHIFWLVVLFGSGFLATNASHIHAKQDK